MIWTTFLWIWSHLAFVSALAGLGVVWFIWPRFALVGVPVAVLIAVSAVLGAFGWGELRYIDGRNSGASVERAKWEKSFALLQSDMEAEKSKASAALERIRANYVEELNSKRQLQDDLRASTAGYIAVLGNEPEQTITCEKANEKVVYSCPNPYRVVADPRIVRNLKAGRGQN